MVEGARLESVCTLIAYRGFESLSHRHNKPLYIKGFLLFQGWLCCINAVLADKGYDTNEIRVWLKERHLQAVIPPKSNRIEGIECDFLQYKERHVIECLFSKLKYYRRRVATRSFLLALIYRIMYIMLNNAKYPTKHSLSCNIYYHYILHDIFYKPSSSLPAYK